MNWYRTFLAISIVGAMINAPSLAQADSLSCPSPASSYAGGAGSINDPFLISTPQELQRLRSRPTDATESFLITADIDMAGCVWDSPLGRVSQPWTGVLDGGGHVISGLDIATSDTWVGLVGALGSGGVVRNIGFTGDITVNASVPAGTTLYAGGLVGRADFGTIANSFASGSISVTFDAPDDQIFGESNAFVFAGGLVGYSHSDVTDSYALGSMQVTVTAVGSSSAEARLVAGGLVGQAQIGAISDSYARGGVVSSLSANGSQVNTSTVYGGAIGTLAHTSSASGIAFDTTTAATSTGVGAGSAAGVSGFPTTSMKQYATFGPSGLNWAITDGSSLGSTWGICPTVNGGYPFLSTFESATVCGATPPDPIPPAPIPPVTATPPRDVTATAGDRSADVTWLAPASSGSFAVSTYQATSFPGGRTCLVSAPTLSCEVTGLTNGTSYTFTVKALTGAGWSAASEPSNAVTPRADTGPSIVITGSRDGRLVKVLGTSTGLGMGPILRPWFRFPGQSGHTEGSATILVNTDGTFEWGRKAGKRVSVYVQTPDRSVRSNTVIIAAR